LQTYDFFYAGYGGARDTMAEAQLRKGYINDRYSSGASEYGRTAGCCDDADVTGPRFVMVFKKHDKRRTAPLFDGLLWAHANRA